MSIMQLEVPLFTLASSFNMSYAANSTTCNGFYTSISLDATAAAALCADPSNTFNFM
jgi:hypothetical protein